MKLHLLLIGNKFIYNLPLREYVIRKVEEKYSSVDSITFFKESDNSLFLYLEQELNLSNNLIIVTSKRHYSTIGKVICTVTGDNQILKDGMLIPSNSSIFEERSYLLAYKSATVNVLHIDEMQKFPELLLYYEDATATMHIFDEDKESAVAILSPLAQTYDVKIELVTLIEGWVVANIASKKYGNISKFLSSSKQLLSKRVIASSCIFSYIIDRLNALNKKITFAESCSGGLLTYYFAKNNGASKIFNGSLITYSNDLKENWLGVDNKTLLSNGAVSAEVVAEMSEGAMNVSSADYSIAISGVAGDSGGTKEKPVGTVFVGVRNKSGHIEMRLNLSGDRNYIQQQSVFFAIKTLLLMDKEVFF